MFANLLRKIIQKQWEILPKDSQPVLAPHSHKRTPRPLSERIRKEVLFGAETFLVGFSRHRIKTEREALEAARRIGEQIRHVFVSS